MIQDFYAAVIYNAFGGTNGNAGLIAKPPSGAGAIQTKFPADVATEILNDAEWIILQ